MEDHTNDEESVPLIFYLQSSQIINCKKLRHFRRAVLPFRSEESWKSQADLNQILTSVKLQSFRTLGFPPETTFTFDLSAASVTSAAEVSFDSFQIHRCSIETHCDEFRGYAVRRGNYSPS